MELLIQTLTIMGFITFASRALKIHGGVTVEKFSVKSMLLTHRSKTGTIVWQLILLVNHFNKTQGTEYTFVRLYQPQVLCPHFHIYDTPAPVDMLLLLLGVFLHL